MFVPLVYTATVALFSLRSLVSAVPLVARAGQGAWNPPITTPREGDVWTAGSPQNVTWDTSNIPPSAVNKTGMLLLGYYGESDGENLDIDNPLASGFPLNAGIVCFDLPDVQARDTYIVVLMGNSGNASPEFTIINPSLTSAISSSNKAISQNGSNKFDPSQLPPDLPATPAPPVSPATPKPSFSDPGIDHMETEPLSEGAPPPAFCRERNPSLHSGGAPSQGPDPVEGDKRC